MMQMRESSEKQTILIVDDVPANIRILGESLKAHYNIRLATDGKKALEIALSMNPPDLILLDIVMPGLDGYEVCKLLKADKRSENTPVIFITAMDQEEDETLGLEIGAVDYITKPFSLPIVKARIKTHLELKRHRDFLENLSNLDGLTGIPNRRRFNEAMDMEWFRAIRAGSSIALLMMDIDYFKSYNDTYGHVSGDDCLKQVARSMKGQMHRPADLIARYGGEEFACLLPRTDINGAIRVAENMRKAVAALRLPHTDSQISEHVTISIGVAVAKPEAEKSPAQLLASADECLYKAKNSGRNRIINMDLSDPA